MSVRNIDSNLIQIIRDLQEDVRLLKANQGATRLNSIRLGNWVLQTVDDSLVQMTNLTTGEVSYIGGVGGGDTITNIIDQTVVAEFPPFSLGGVIRNAFGTTIKTNAYIVPNDIVITRIITTLAVTTAETDGPIYRIYQNGVIVYTSGEILSNYVSDDVELTFLAEDVIYMECHDAGDGDSIGLTVMLRRGT